ncbi:MAG: VCBS repeat-containing protein [Pirellulales bacterium]|nr:VCBS repeat-containing protein [Pirellulales bacterium]
MNLHTIRHRTRCCEGLATHQRSFSRRLFLEPLEDRRLLSVECPACYHPSGVVDVTGTASTVEQPTMEVTGLNPWPGSPSGDVVVEGQDYSVPLLADWDSDGLVDLLVGEKTTDGQGKVSFYRNTGTAEQPTYENPVCVTINGEDLTVDAEGCLGVFPRVADLDGDGNQDLILGRADGRIQLFQNIIGNDSSDEDTCRPSLDSSIFLEFGLPGAKQQIDVGLRATPDVADYNGDDRLDLVVGALDGQVRVFLNESASGLPDFREATNLSVDDELLVVPEMRSSPSMGDLNGDDLKDLLCGNTEGQLYLYTNVGTNEAPLWAGGKLVEVEGRTIDLPGAARSRPFVGDYNNDGTNDILVGAADGVVRLYAGAELTFRYPSPLHLVDAEGRTVEIDFNENTVLVGAATWCGVCSTFKDWTTQLQSQDQLAGLRLVFAFGDESDLGQGTFVNPTFLEGLPGEVVFIGSDSAAAPSAFPTLYDLVEQQFTTSISAFEWVESWLEPVANSLPLPTDAGDSPPPTAMNRQIYDCSFGFMEPGCFLDLEYGGYTFGRSEGQPERGPNPLEGTKYFGLTDVDDAYDLLGQAQTYYWEKFGRNGANNLGGVADPGSADPTVTRAHTFRPDDYSAAFTGDRFSFGTWSVVPDSVGRAYSDAVNYFALDWGDNPSFEYFTLRLSYDDVMGEMFEYYVTGTNDWIHFPARTTQVGPPNLADPNSTPHDPPYADRFHSPDFYCGDTGYKWTWNKGVPNKAAYLATMGGSFNSCEVQGLGHEKVEKIWYRANMTYFTVSETFNSAYVQACLSTLEEGRLESAEENAEKAAFRP